jgi:hypothetical protein
MKDKNLWMELIRLIYVEGRLTKAVLAQTCMGVIFISSMSNTIFTMFFSSEIAADHLANRRGPPVVRGPQFEKHCFRY